MPRFDKASGEWVDPDDGQAPVCISLKLTGRRVVTAFADFRCRCGGRDCLKMQFVAESSHDDGFHCDVVGIRLKCECGRTYHAKIAGRVPVVHLGD